MEALNKRERSVRVLSSAFQTGRILCGNRPSRAGKGDLDMSERSYLITMVISLAVLIGATSYALSQSIASESDVQIVAQKLEDGRIEFGLEQDGERILPRTRYFPADALVGRWLKSSTIRVEAALSKSVSQAIPSEGYRSINGSDASYRSAGYFGAGNHVCSIEVCENHDKYGEDHVAVVSYGADGSYGNLHANGITDSYPASLRLVVGSGWSADVPVDEVYFEVTVFSKGAWSISCR